MNSYLLADKKCFQGNVLDTFQKLSKESSDKIAIASENRFLTYQELNIRANSLAHFLRTNLKIKEGDVVGVLADKTERTIISLLAIFKVGATYLPLEPSYPEQRLLTILDSSNVSLIILESVYFHKVKGLSKIPMFALDFQLHTIPRIENDIITSFLNDSTAYLIFTSGSTGMPKGISISHEAFSNMIESQVTTFEIQPFDKILQFASIGFDVSLFEIFLSLTSGSALYLISNKIVKNKELFWDFIYRCSLNVCVIPPSYFPYIDKKKFQTVRVVCTGGESVSPDSVMKLLSDGLTVINQYGLTETTCNALVYKMKSGSLLPESVPVGYPIQNTSIYILNDQLEAVPRGEEGQICISGQGLFKEYLNAPELTSQKLIDNPFEVGEKLFLTGDIGVMSSEGLLFFKARSGGQIKIRQHRVELSEIKFTVLKFPEVLNAFIDYQANDDEKQLIIYYTARKEVSGTVLREFIARYLPEYMIPSIFCQLETFPITINGKIDKQALPRPKEIVLAKETTTDSATTDTESQLVTIWKSVLGVSNAGVDDNLFEVGGNSIKVIKIYEQVNGIYGDVISISDLYDNPTIRKQALLLDHKLLVEGDNDIDTISF